MDQRVKKGGWEFCSTIAANQGVSRMKASSTDHPNQPINAGQKVNIVGNTLVVREASEYFLIQSPSLLHWRYQLWQSSLQRIIDLCSVSSRLDLDQRCFLFLLVWCHIEPMTVEQSHSTKRTFSFYLTSCDAWLDAS